MSASAPRHARHRRCILLRGDPPATRQRALDLIAALPPAARLWLSPHHDPEADARPRHAARRLLGRAFDVVVLDLHDGVDADLLGLVHGFIWGGGRLILRMPPPGHLPAGDPLGLAVHPYGPADVAHRFWRRLDAHLLASPACEPPPARPLAPALHIDHGSDDEARVVDALTHHLRADDPRMVVLLGDRGRGKSSALGLALASLLADRRPRAAAITAAAPEALAEVFRFALGDPAVRTDLAAPLRYIPLADLLRDDIPLTHLLIDEAAQLPVPLLQRLALRHPGARIALATTARGYEGTGRGFVLRFLDWARRQPRPLTELHLHAPIRWAPQDPLERLIFDLLALDAEPARLDPDPLPDRDDPAPRDPLPDRDDPASLPDRDAPAPLDALRDRDERIALSVDGGVGAAVGRQRRAPPEESRSSTDLAQATAPQAAHARDRGGGGAPARDPPPPPPCPAPASPTRAPAPASAHALATPPLIPPHLITAEHLDRDALSADEQHLRDLFGLLVHAHYRTTPADLQRALDAPNLDLHVLRRRRRIVAATLIAREGNLPPELTDAIARGALRIRGHALPDTLIAHAGAREAGPMSIVRSVRIAVHPELRRLGLARRLIDHVHAAYPHADLFGTLFGATPELLAFRRAVGYRLVRLGVARGARTGEPAAVMLRPVTPAAHDLTDRLRGDLARALPRQLDLLVADGDLVLDLALETALRADLPTPPPLTPAARAGLVRAYAHGTQPVEAVAHALDPWLRDRPLALAALAPTARAVVVARVLEGRPWPEVARLAGLPGAAAAMRAIRPAIRAILAAE